MKDEAGATKFSAEFWECQNEGSDHFKNQVYKGIMFAFIVFDVSNRNTFLKVENVGTLHTIVSNECKFCVLYPHTVIVLLRNCRDCKSFVRSTLHVFVWLLVINVICMIIKLEKLVQLK